MTTRAASRVARTAATPRGASWIEALAVHIVFVLVVVFFLVPFVWLFTAAFDADAVAYIRFPAQPTLDNFVRIFTEHDFARALLNSVFVAGSTMVLDVIAVALAGYSLSRLEWRFKSWITYAVLLLQTMPLSATMVPIYGLARALGLRNSYAGLILIHAAIELPFLIWLMKNFFIDSQDLKTVPLAFYETLRTQGGYTEVQYGLVAAMGVLYAVPVMIIFLATRRMMVRGLIASSRGL